MFLYLTAVALIAAGALASLMCGSRKEAAGKIGAWSLAAGSAVGLAAAVGGGTGIEKFFQLPILILSAAGALYSPGYLAGHGDRRANVYWFFFNLTSASMLCVTLAARPLPFLLAWEAMGLTSGALVMFDRERESARRAAWLYFAACHAGAALLMLFFLFPDSGKASILLALGGFGLKIGFPLLHVWLPEAHPAAPAPVSALMSGAMIALGYLGLFRFVCTPETALFTGWCLLALGIAGSLGGIVFALPQNDLKRLLAYSSVENMGLAGISAGLWMLGTAYGVNGMALAGMCGAIIHILNHALLKGALFLGAGSVLKAAGTLDIDRLGGLMRRMPFTGTLFSLNAAGLCGLPPFNGFVGEFIIYWAAFEGIVHGGGLLRAGASAALLAVALTGGTAAAAMAKAAGMVFLGEPRSSAAAGASEVSKGMIAAEALLLLLSVIAVLFAPCIISAIGGGESPLTIAGGRAALACGIFSGLTAILCLLQRCFAVGGVRRSATWDCGYARPDSRMEYTGTAFTQPLTDLFSPILKVKKNLHAPEGIFPVSAELETRAEDGGMAGFWRPLASAAVRTAEFCHNLQSGNLHFYILLILLTAGGMLVYAMMKG